MFIVLADEQLAMVTNVRHLASKVLCYINDKQESFDIDSFYEDLPELEGTKIPYLMLTDKDGNTLECADDEEDCYDFLPRMLMSAEIIGFTSMK